MIMFSKTTCPFCSKAGGIPGYGLRALMALESLDLPCTQHTPGQGGVAVHREQICGGGA